MTGSLNLLHVRSKSIGYGRLGMCWAEELERRGIAIYDDLPSPDPSDAIRRANDSRGEKPRRSGAARTAMWVSVPTHARGWWKEQRPVIATMWEATRLPESFRETLHEFDLVIVPSEQNLELFSRFHGNVVKVPLGIDPLVWKPTPRQTPGMFFNFLIGGSGPRKGTDLAVEAFRLAFPVKEFEPLTRKARLLERCRHGLRLPPRERRESWGDGPIPKLILKNPKSESFGGDRIEVISGRIDAADEVALYEQAHCYLQPSRGEGFGLQPLQAIAQGIPTILTDAHGHAEFSHLGRPIGWKYSKAQYFIYGDAGEWWEPNLDDLVDEMRWVYRNYDQAAAIAHDNARVAAKEFTWEASVDQLLDALGDSVYEPDVQMGDWHKPDLHLYRVMVNRLWSADIAGKTYQFEPQQVYWETADVKRIMFESQVLDPVCLTGDDNGLAESQLRRIGDYSATQSYCAMCHQRLNSGPTRSDDLLAAADG